MMLHVHQPPGILWGYVDTTCPVCGQPVRCERLISEWREPLDVVRGKCKHVERLNCRWGKLAIKFNRSVRALIAEQGWQETGNELPWLDANVAGGEQAKEGA